MILSLTGMGVALALVFASCQKEPISRKGQNIVQDGSKPINNSNSEKQDGHYVRTIWHDNGKPEGVDGIDYGCWDTPGDCLEEVKIYGSLIKDIGDEINQNNNPYNQSNITSLVEENLDFFNKYFNEAVADSLKAGQYRIGVKGNIDEDSRVYFIIKNLEEELIMVRPFKLK